MRQYETYHCNTCGNEVELQTVGGGTLTCCGESMEMITKDLTAVNLMKAFGGESMARNKYELFADIARDEGWHAVERHFREAAFNEMYHARAQYKAYHKLIHGSEFDATLANLDTAMAGEHYEHETMYPGFSEIAKLEGHNDLARLFTAIGKVEVEHEREYAALKEALIADGFFASENDEIWICEVCGHVHRGKKPPVACPLCKVGREYFKREHLH
jgi:desulfoferrodoxin-like iron-binding protein